MPSAPGAKFNTTVRNSNYLLDKNGFVTNEDHICVMPPKDLYTGTLIDTNKTFASYSLLVYINEQTPNAIP